VVGSSPTRPSHQRCRKYGQTFANRLRRRRPRPGDKWHFNKVFIKIRGKSRYLRRDTRTGLPPRSWVRHARPPAPRGSAAPLISPPGAPASPSPSIQDSDRQNRSGRSLSSIRRDYTGGTAHGTTQLHCRNWLYGIKTTRSARRRPGSPSAPLTAARPRMLRTSLSEAVHRIPCSQDDVWKPGRLISGGRRRPHVPLQARDRYTASCCRQGCCALLAPTAALGTSKSDACAGPDSRATHPANR
jgi:hypothetical protein